jgi:MYXO-CTERM domain-containing protein
MFHYYRAFAVLALLSGFSGLANAAIVFHDPVRSSVDTSSEFENGWTWVTDAQPIEFGAEGEVTSAGGAFARRDGTARHIVERDFDITGARSTIVHNMLVAGVWSRLETIGTAAANYSLILTYTDEIVQGTAVRSRLTKSNTQTENMPSRMNHPKNILLRDSDRVTLLPGRYTLRSTLTLAVDIRDSEYELDLSDGVFGPQGLFSVRSDTQGYQSTVVPEPAAGLIMGFALLALAAARSRLRRRFYRLAE